MTCFPFRKEREKLSLSQKIYSDTVNSDSGFLGQVAEAAGPLWTSQDLRDSELLLFDTYFMSHQFKCTVEDGLTVKALFPQHS